MDATTTIIICFAAIVIILFGLSYKFYERKPKKDKKNPLSDIDIKNVHGSDFVNLLNNNKMVQDFGAKIPVNKKLDKLFRMSKNPWHLTPFTFNAIRFGGLAIFLFIGLIVYALLGLPPFFFFAMLGFFCFFIPNKEYKDAANAREAQWMQLYQFMWVIKHNASFYDPKKVFQETSRYIKKHTKNLPELEQGFKDFADHWNGSDMDSYLEKTYGDFSIPKELFDIMVTSYQTGEYPERELDSLREVIIGKMDFYVENTISTVSARATTVSAPFLLASMFVSVIMPVGQVVVSAFV